MPFTLAHPAAVIPFTKSKSELFVPSALVVGSMAPDFEYFLRLQLVTRWSHTLTGVFTFCLPVGLIVLWIYHNLQKDVLYSLLPGDLENHLLEKHQFDFLPIKRFLCICFSMGVGSLTHIIWDGFTHCNGFFVAHSTLLNITVISVGKVDIPLYALLQDLSTAVGLLILAIVMWRVVFIENTLNFKSGNEFRIRIPAIMRLLGFATLLGAIFTLCMKTTLNVRNLRDFLRHIAVVGFPSVYVASIIWAMKNRFHC